MIIQIGPYPPPIGGISIYIKRLKEILDKLNIENEVWTNTCSKEGYGIVKCRNRDILFKVLKNKKNINVIHINQVGIILKIYFGILNVFFGKKIKKIITIHGDCKYLFNGIHAIFMRMALNTFDVIICVKKNDSYILRKNGVKTKIIEESAFLNPVEFDELPIIIDNFIKDSDFVISGNASSLNKLYSLEETIYAISKLKDCYKEKKITYIVLLPQVDNRDELNRLNSIIKNLNLSENICLYTENKIDFSSLIKRSNLTIRPTKEDGYGVSLAESINLNVPALASDVCNRANGTILFKSENYDDMLDKIKDIIDNYDKYLRLVEQVVIKDAKETILELYKEKNL